MKILFCDAKSLEIDYINQNFKNENIEFIFKSCPLTLDEVAALKKEELSETEGISTFVSSNIDETILSNFKNLKFIYLRSTGYSNVDLKYCKERNIKVFNVADYGINTVAEYTFALILGLAKNIKNFSFGSNTLSFDKSSLKKLEEPQTLEGVELSDKTLGLIGAGSIGKRVIDFAKCFNMEIIVYDIKKNTDYEYVELDELLKRADFVTINCPLTEKTRSMINKEKLNLMKPSAYIINTARGEIINTEDLYEAIKLNKIKGAALDVVECEKLLFNNSCKSIEEIKKDDECYKKFQTIKELIKLDNVILTPHNAYNTKDAKERIIKTTLENILISYDILFGKIDDTFVKNLVLP